MISSMTAFAREEYRGELGNMSWEIRSVNHRYLEAFLRLPEELRALEPNIRERLNNRLGRGKLDVSLKYKAGTSGDASLCINQRLVEQLIDVDQQLADMIELDPSMRSGDLLRWPGVLEEEERDYTPVKVQAMQLLETALDSLIDNRLREGERLGEIIGLRCDALASEVGRVRGLMPDVLESVRSRIKDRLNEVMEELDESRVEQEMVLLAQRLDVDEELDRLETHIEEVRRVLESDEPIGRRLDFLMQELNREANTLTSKSNSVDVTRSAVEMKVLIEQMREQVQNLE
ncbi:MAG: YicC family protein [Candidatus Thiodiazotropha lotti]|uniref:YicC/YloC family endoribonuclease n=1 Tax=Candidatus Thiodiazotropha endoloripes TaxID=1818881 RepID=UPI00083E2F52|nr:YicC/YloC family endoribonuclease [Candidatus Thiodiazotropha endoloripes]MCG7899888.1 YicC family protein [Candidatus Thiodiazotropha weberae]MCG7993356.1 YicC family protein [Candidatus Thiodiazotropha lotti]MCG7904725.1 YicC family protein [Candidatus Thiodiazotropha weberae]MCG7998127.1 YicC family protein [Candidatus Thiodiazotropha lotti]MCW4185018.1 YicC family protein [Candidatus Thiodiazotropha weberae]